MWKVETFILQGKKLRIIIPIASRKGVLPRTQSEVCKVSGISEVLWLAKILNHLRSTRLDGGRWDLNPALVANQVPSS